jgi:hypothetical protein
MCRYVNKKERYGFELQPLKTLATVICKLPATRFSMGNPFKAPEPPRIARLRSKIVAAIPCLPSNAFAFLSPRRQCSKRIVGHRNKCNWPMHIVGTWNWPGSSSCLVLATAWPETRFGTRRDRRRQPD